MVHVVVWSTVLHTSISHCVVHRSSHVVVWSTVLLPLCLSGSFANFTGSTSTSTSTSGTVDPLQTSIDALNAGAQSVGVRTLLIGKQRRETVPMQLLETSRLSSDSHLQETVPPTPETRLNQLLDTNDGTSADAKTLNHLLIPPPKRRLGQVAKLVKVILEIVQTSTLNLMHLKNQILALEPIKFAQQLRLALATYANTWRLLSLHSPTIIGSVGLEGVGAGGGISGPATGEGEYGTGMMDAFSQVSFSSSPTTPRTIPLLSCL